MRKLTNLAMGLASLAIVAAAMPASAAIIYDPGVAPSVGSSGLTFGNHLVGAVAHTSVAGSGGAGLSDAGDTLDGVRTFTYDFDGAADLADGVANRGDAGFAMMIWDM